MDSGAFKEILTADVATQLGLLLAEEASAALAAYWKDSSRRVLDAIPAEHRPGIEAEIDRILRNADGDVRRAVLMRGIDRELPASLSPEASHAISEAGARLRAPLRSLDKKRYVGFLPLGQGGMGVVYLALDSELNRRVAFKMIRSGETDPLADESGPVSDDMIARFLQEAVVTGGLEHPGIVPVYEMGVTPSGVPYYTMRLVRGERTFEDAINDAHTVEDRLGLLESFLKVCDAVGYAHSRGVVHRDLKPANIALGQFGEVVVLDWGLAKMQQRPDLAGSRWQSRLDELREMTDLRTLTSALGTPGYMAPEAAFGEIDKIDERADLYSLGAILYRVLTGKLPIEFTSFQQYIVNLAKGISAVPGAPAGLERITIQALSPRRQDRYQSVGQLAAAIRAWQRESAVEREIDGLLKEAEASLETAGGLAGDALLRQLDAAIAVASRILELKSSHPRARAIRDNARELRAGAIAEGETAARRRLLKRVGVVSLLAATAATIVVAMLLNTRREQAERAQTRAEDLAGFMLNDLHEGLVPVGRLDLLATVARKSLDYYASLPSDDLTREAQLARAKVLGRIGEVLQATGDLDGALRSCQESKRIYEALGERYEHSKALNLTGDVQQESGDLEGALASYRRSAEIRRELGDNYNLPRSLSRVADVLMRMGRREEAIAIYEDELRLDEDNARSHPDKYDAQRHYAQALEKQGDLAHADDDLKKAREYYDESLAIRRRVLEEDPTDSRRLSNVASCLFRIAHCQGQAGDTEAREKTFEEVRGIYQQLVDRDPSDIWHQRHLAMTLQRLGKHQDALQVMRRIAELDPRNTRAQHDVLQALIGIGDRAGKDRTLALQRYEEALEIARALVARDRANTEWQVDLASALQSVATVYAATKRQREADDALAEALAIMKRLTELSPKTLLWQRKLAKLHDLRDDFESSVAVRRKLYEADPKNTTSIRELAWALSKLGEKTKDPALFEEAVRLRRKLPDSDAQRREIAFCLYMIGTIHEERGELGLALPPLRKAVPLHKSAKGYEREHHFWWEAYFRVNYNAACEAATGGRTREALELLGENLAWSRRNLPAKRLEQHLEHVRKADPDMKSLRGLPEFEALVR
ncbi:MAG: tetratricopeptide repeat protein [Planctomycetota bacterium]